MRKKKLLKYSGLAVVLALSLALIFAGCGNKADNTDPEPERELVSITLSYSPGNYYVVGETLREPNNSIELTYSDKSIETVSTADPSVTITGDTSTTGKHTGTIEYGDDFKYTFTYNVYEALDDTITIDSGEIRGYQTADGEVEIYKGIPYAAPPVGDLRWRSPRDVENWDNILECYHFGPSPIQNVRSNNDYLINPWSGTSEDCLTVNVWTNGTDIADKPVLVFIYGGGYTAGGGSVPIYDGEAMARKDVVFVNFNYRLGKFGFLATEELKAENDGCGNFAILDQIKALQWVQNNIANFGGNPDNVTIMGQSAGAMSVEALLASPFADGLYHNAAILSAGMYFTKDLSDMETAISASNATATMEELRAMTTEEANKAVKQTNGNVVYDNYVITSPSTKEAFAKSAAYSKDVNIMVGCVTGDAGLYGDMRSMATATREESIICQRNMLVNAHILGGGTGKNWQYYYSYVQSGARTAGHTDDVTFWLGNTTNQYNSWSETDGKMSDLLSDYLVNFCKTGNPNGEGLPAWEESRGDYGYLHIDGIDSIEYVHISETSVNEFETAYSELSKYFPQSVLSF